MLAEIMG